MKTYRLHLNFTIELDGSLPDFSCVFFQPSNELAEDYAKKILGLMARHIPTIDGGLLLDETEKHAVEYAITRKPAIVEIRARFSLPHFVYDMGCAIERARGE